MSFGGAVQHLNKVIKENRALLTSKRKSSHPKSGKSFQGKKPIRFKKANKNVKQRIKRDKAFLAKQLRFRIGLLVVCVIFVLLLFALFYNFG